MSIAGANIDEILIPLLARWRGDPGGTYRTWFLWEERIKNFHSIRRGLTRVISEIETGKFGSAYRGSSLETVVGSIAEQRQIFKGADHAFLWKPKLRIPDIYENRENQRAFGQFLQTCLECGDEAKVLESIRSLDARKIKGLGPAAANLLYFLHPTIMPPTNTAIVRGYNLLTGAKVKLGRWEEYLAMRAGILRMNNEHRDDLSNDLGAIAGFLFDVGAGRYPLPGRDIDENGRVAWKADLERVRETAAQAKVAAAAEQFNRTHTEIQGWLRDLGLKWGYQVWIAANDQGRPYAQATLGQNCLGELPKHILETPAVGTIRLIDVLWIKPGDSSVVAFEVEHTTTIYSGILRLYDLARSDAGHTIAGLYLVAPDEREKDIRAQMARPAFQTNSNLSVRYLPYSELEQHRDAMARFGDGIKALEAASRSLP